MKLKVNKAIAGKRLTVLMLVMMCMCFTVANVWGYNFGYSLYIKDAYIGTFATEEEAKAISYIIEAEDGVKIAGEEKIVYEVVNGGFTDKNIACDKYRMTDERYTLGYTLMLEGKKIFSVSCEEDAYAVINEVLDGYNEEGAVSTKIIEQHEIVEDYVLKSSLDEKTSATKLLEDAATIETIVKLSYYEAVPYETVTVEDDTVYHDKQIVENEGKSGEKYVEHTTYKIDGEFISESITGEYIITEIENRVIRQGTKAYPKGEAVGEFMNPAEGYISSPFGPRWGRMHKGIDVAAPSGTPMYASDGGVVIYSGWMSGYGYLVQIDHKNGFVTYYAHCSQLHVNVGDEVARGELIADMGSTGNSTGPHLHFEVRLDNVPQNPENYVNYR